MMSSETISFIYDQNTSPPNESRPYTCTCSNMQVLTEIFLKSHYNYEGLIYTNVQQLRPIVVPKTSRYNKIIYYTNST